MPEQEPATELDPQFSSPDATATPWKEGRRLLANAELYWLSTVRPDGRPHVTPLIGIWLDDAFYFCTGPTERKAHNLETNTHCVVTTGQNALSGGMDVVVEGDAVHIRDEARLQQIADAYAAKYEPPFQFTVRDGDFAGDGGRALVFEVRPRKVFGFGKLEAFSQTRWRFGP